MSAIPQINQQISELFKHKADLLTARGEKYKFRALAYNKAATAINQLERGLDDIYKNGWLVGLRKVKGIGHRLAHEIEKELIKKGIKNNTSYSS